MNKNFLPLKILVITGLFNFNMASAQQSNILTEKEKQEGWQLLFNGKDLKGWHSYLLNKPGKAWQVEDGTIFLNKNDKSRIRRLC